jgi:V8-like Glu-specific endopeptidase
MSRRNVYSATVTVTSLVLLFGCDSRPDDGLQSASTSVTGAKPDLTFNGRRYAWSKKAVLHAVQPDHVVVEDHAMGVPPAAALTAQQLAEDLRTHVLVGDDEYVATEPDLALAKQLIEGTAPAQATKGYDPTPARSPAAGVEQKTGAWVIGNDERSRVGCARLNFPARTRGFWNTWCGATMIGPHTAATAAHCVYKPGTGWLSGRTFIPAKDSPDLPGCTNPEPFGTFGSTAEGHAGVFIAVSSGWTDRGDHNYDFAMLDFTDNPGNLVGFSGTTFPALGNVTAQHQGYPLGKPMFPQYWGQTATVGCGESNACPYYPGGQTYNARFVHYMDQTDGDSGSGIIRTDTSQLIAIMSTENKSCFFWSCSYWNEGTAWTPTVFNFFHQFNDWP